jgi:diguanylate cyclase (GGDEF)-like protein
MRDADEAELPQRVRMLSPEPRVTTTQATAGFVVLSRSAAVHTVAMSSSATAHQLYLVARNADELLATINATMPCAVIIDQEDSAAEHALRRIAGLVNRDQTRVLLVVREVPREPPPGAHAVVLEAALGEALELTGSATLPEAPLRVSEQLLRVSVLAGPLDQALEVAADQIAAGFGVDRCVISIRGDSTGGAAGGGHTWDSLAWSRTADHCRAAVASVATLIVPASNRARECESYLAVPFDSPMGSQGFLGIVAARPRIFSNEHRVALQAIAARLGAELGWRAVHQRNADELDRVVNGPSVDLLLGVWNRMAVADLTRMHVSSSHRFGLPLAVIIIDVLDLQGINTRYGLDTGDRVLRRIADTMRTTLRTEDLIGRWSGDKFAIILQGTPAEGAQRVAERLQAALAARPLDLSTGGTLGLPATVGVAALQTNEDSSGLIARAIVAAKTARDGGTGIAHASNSLAPRLSQPMDLGEDLRTTLGGSYRLLHEISRGGMGVVYRAEDLSLERPVAIKMLRPDLAEDRAFVENLRIEAAMLARLQHPNLVQIYSFGQSGGDSYFVMELVEGEGLFQAVERHRLEGTTMPPAELAAVIDEIASALDALHDRGIVHRDVKPANIIRDPFRNRSVLVDVGIARRHGQSAQSAGTPGFVAPEVIAGEEASPRADVYGLAATAYTLLTLSAPWGEGDGVLARQCSGEDVPLLSSLRPELAVADDLLVNALSADPLKRPASAGELARALRVALAISAPKSKPEGARWLGNMVVPSRSAMTPRTSGVVFRSVARALGARDAERLRDGIGGTHSDLARALTDVGPLEWLPTELLSRLLAVAPTYVGRDGTRLARDIARATVRASFRRFFPASAVTLVPERTLSAIRNVWSRYQSWGTVSCMPVKATETVVRISGTTRDPMLCVWTSGMLEQLVILSGARTPVVDHHACEVEGSDACLFRVTWERPE